MALIVVYVDLAETNRNRSSSFRQQFRTYPELISSPRFWGYTLTAMFASGAFFAFLGGGPYVSTEMLKLTPSQYGFYFGIISIGYMLGNFISGRFSRRIGMNRMMFAGNVAATIGLAVSLLLFLGGSMHPLALFGPAAFVGIGNGMTLPSANAGIVSVRPHLAGSASGLGGALTAWRRRGACGHHGSAPVAGVRPLPAADRYLAVGFRRNAHDDLDHAQGGRCGRYLMPDVVGAHPRGRAGEPHGWR